MQISLVKLFAYMQSENLIGILYNNFLNRKILYSKQCNSYIIDMEGPPKFRESN